MGGAFFSDKIKKRGELIEDRIKKTKLKKELESTNNWEMETKSKANH